MSATPCTPTDEAKPESCATEGHDHFTTRADWMNGHEDPFPATAVFSERHGDDVIPMTCEDCGVPTYYDYGDDNYHHVDAGASCFLIPARA